MTDIALLEPLEDVSDEQSVAFLREIAAEISPEDPPTRNWAQGHCPLQESSATGRTDAVQSGEGLIC
jgi:hypothetical protein